MAVYKKVINLTAAQTIAAGWLNSTLPVDAVLVFDPTTMDGQNLQILAFNSGMLIDVQSISANLKKITLISLLT